MSELHTCPKSYEFGYSVKDSRSGNDYDRKETSDGHEVRGQYRVQLPDGRTQIVTYHADWQTGFHADVRYEGEARYPEPAYNNQQGGYHYDAPTEFIGSLTGFHNNAIQTPSVVYGPPRH
ncbi:cuticle protein 19-like [Battus philenor]|uniref:cuticle protein 19-like n=1 Tax=Battus philenor TaxID=42288 RepID=UPI0035CF9406